MAAEQRKSSNSLLNRKRVMGLVGVDALPQEVYHADALVRVNILGH